MTNEKQNERQKTTRWKRPSLRYVGSVGEIFLFPGSGKVSTANYDTGDTPFKPKGQEK